MAINKQKYLKLFRESEGFFSEWYKENRLLVLAVLPALGGAGGTLYFYTIIENMLPRVKILEKMDLVQFETGNHKSLLISNSLLKGIRQGRKRA